MQQVVFQIETSKYIATAILSVKLKNGKVESRAYQIQRKSESVNLIGIMALSEGLKHLIRPVELIFYVSPGYISISLESIEKWRGNGFKNKKGEEIKYAEIWKEIAAELEKHEVKIKIKKKQEEEE